MAESDSNTPMIRSEKSLDWTDKRVSVKDRNAKYLGNELRSDMVFHVERDNIKIPAHRLIVASASPVLESIAYGSGNIPGAHEDVPVKDCSAEEFYEVLRFVYTDDCKLTPSNAATILLLAHYYDLGTLEDACAAHLLGILSPKNVCKIFGRLHLMDNALTKECLQVIQANTDQLFADGNNLFDLELAALGQIFKLDVLLLDSDVELFRVLLEWGRAQSSESAKHDLASMGNRLRETLNGRLQFIRFTAMTIEQFGQCIQMVDPSFFTNDEICTAYQHIVRGEGYAAAADADGVKTLTMYTKPREPYYGGEEWILPLGDKSSAISRLSIRIESDYAGMVYLHGFNIFANDTRFTVVQCETGDDDHDEVLNTLIDFKIYGNRVLFKEALAISNCVLIITYDNFVQAKCIAAETQHDNVRLLSEDDDEGQECFFITFGSLLYTKEM